MLAFTKLDTASPILFIETIYMEREITIKH